MNKQRRRTGFGAPLCIGTAAPGKLNSGDDLMKKLALLLLPVCLLATGCRQSPTEKVQPQPRQLPRTVYSGTADTQCAEILKDIWTAYTPEDRFFVYGGSPQRPVENGPGDVLPADTQFLTDSFFVPRQLFYSIAEGASLQHQINPKLFSCAVLKITKTQEEAFAQVMRGSIRGVRWQGSRPERYLIAAPREEFILVAFGNREMIKTFSQYLQQACEQGRILYEEPICVGIEQKT